MLGLAWDVKVAKVRQPLPQQTPEAVTDEALPVPDEAVA
jgi:hypothetical protein